jgi:GrpB-like predicted nucleotidyltransferase (UPF0157 family)
MDQLIPVLGLPEGEFFLRDWSSEWSRLFKEEKDRITDGLGNMILDIQHVGSTSIPGLCAKPVLDIMVGVRNFEAAIETVEPLSAIGYTFRGEHGLARRHYFTKGSPRTHQLHMWELDTDEWTRHLAFRDYLRANADARDRYALMKRDMSRQAKTRAEYQNSKDPLFPELQAQALEWVNSRPAHRHRQ